LSLQAITYKDLYDKGIILRVAAAFNKKNISIKSRCFLGSLKKKNMWGFIKTRMYTINMFSAKKIFFDS
jgi:hypothetical protein